MDESKIVLLGFLADDTDDQALLHRLGRDVEQLELGAVEYRYAAPTPGKAAAELVEWVGVALGATGTLIELVRLGIEWSQRSRRPVRVRIDDDELVLDHTSDLERDAIIQGFLDRHRAPDDAA